MRKKELNGELVNSTLESVLKILILLSTKFSIYILKFTKMENTSDLAFRGNNQLYLLNSSTKQYIKHLYPLIEGIGASPQTLQWVSSKVVDTVLVLEENDNLWFLPIAQSEQKKLTDLSQLWASLLLCKIFLKIAVEEWSSLLCPNCRDALKLTKAKCDVGLIGSPWKG